MNEKAIARADDIKRPISLYDFKAFGEAIKEARLSQERHKEQRFKNRLKYYEKGERDKRTHCLCTWTVFILRKKYTVF